MRGGLPTSTNAWSWTRRCQPSTSRAGGWDVDGVWMGCLELDAPAIDREFDVKGVGKVYKAWDNRALNASARNHVPCCCSLASLCDPHPHCVDLHTHLRSSRSDYVHGFVRYAVPPSPLEEGWLAHTLEPITVIDGTPFTTDPRHTVMSSAERMLQKIG